MGLFGDKDASEIPDDPFYVAPDVYECVLAEASVIQKKDGSGQGLAFKWVIEEPDSEYNGNNLNDWKNIYPDVPSDEKTSDMRKDESRLKQRLVQMGIPEDAQNSLLDNLDDLVGLRAVLTVIEQTDRKDVTKKHTNISKVEVQ